MSSPLLPTPWMYGRRRLTRVEMAVYALIMAIMSLVFASYVLDFMEMAEKTAMETTVTNVTAALNLQYAGRLMAAEPVKAEQWMARNPFQLAGAFPAGYKGQLPRADASPVERPAWLFDPARREVLYLPRFHDHLRVQDQPADAVRFRMQPHPSGFGFVLVPVAPYAWVSSGNE